MGHNCLQEFNLKYACPHVYRKQKETRDVLSGLEAISKSQLSARLMTL